MATKEATPEVNATLEEALENAGTTVLSHLGSRAHKLTVEEVKEYEEDNGLRGAPKEGEYRAYDGPYTDPDDGRNVWTHAQETGDTSRVSEQLPEETASKKKDPKRSAPPAPKPAGNPPKPKE